MSDRVLEADDHADAMNRMYRSTRHIYDITRKYYLLGRDRLIDQIDAPTGGTILEIGCGTGRNLIQTAIAYPSARLFGIDISEEMLKTARTKIEEAGLSNRITVAQGDATSFDARTTFGLASFDRVFFSYTLSMIPEWRAAIRHAHGLLGIAGWLLVVDFGRCDRLPGLFRRLLWLWLRKFDVTPRVDLKEALIEVAQESRRSLRVERPHRGYAQFFVMR